MTKKGIVWLLAVTGIAALLVTRVKDAHPVMAQYCGCASEPPWCPSGEIPLCQGSGWVCGYTPIIVDPSGNGFALTSPDNGVLFDIRGRGAKDLVAWIAPGSDDAFLALDRNGNGTIDSGKELFGDSTEQETPPGQVRNGFLALAVFDKLSEGGNGDDVISRRNQVYDQLRLWRDTNRDGVSQPNELLDLESLGVRSISLDYRESKRTDEFGNRFKFRSRVRPTAGSDVGRWAWDVYLLTITIQTGESPSATLRRKDGAVALTPPASDCPNLCVQTAPTKAPVPTRAGGG